ncbi:hypothetical protein BC826DRAFT_1037295 [Russula brevipes]|nr:hypothetical protein BC826DRAFT_1037295 [Russula brevipes]
MPLFLLVSHTLACIGFASPSTTLVALIPHPPIPHRARSRWAHRHSPQDGPPRTTTTARSTPRASARAAGGGGWFKLSKLAGHCASTRTSSPGGVRA